MDVPFAAVSLVPSGTFLRWAAKGGKIEMRAPPSISHFSLVLGSRIKRRFPVFASRDAAAFTSGVPLARFPPACLFVAF